jgi:holo-[acyl-carrier protein] synthase
MFVHGVGVDITHAPRIARLLTRFGTRFLTRAFHPTEIAHSHTLSAEARTNFLAGRWALKEATLKAFGQRILFPEVTLQTTDSRTLYNTL